MFPLIRTLYSLPISLRIGAQVPCPSGLQTLWVIHLPQPFWPHILEFFPFYPPLQPQWLPCWFEVLFLFLDMPYCFIKAFARILSPKFSSFTWLIPAPLWASAQLLPSQWDLPPYLAWNLPLPLLAFPIYALLIISPNPYPTKILCNLSVNTI